MRKFEFMDGCLLFNPSRTAEPISMKFRTQIDYSPEHRLLFISGKYTVPMGVVPMGKSLTVNGYAFYRIQI